jgi:hypothetical protein
MLSLSLAEASDSGYRVAGFGGGEGDCSGPAASVARCRALGERLARNGTGVMDVPASGPFGDVTGIAEFAQEFMANAGAGRRFSDYLRRTSPAPDSTHRSIMLQAGLPFLTATGTSNTKADLQLNPAGFTLHVELAAYPAHGVTPLEALQSVTLNPAKWLHASDSLGTVAAGKLADLVLLDADPLADITNTTTIRAVVANGRYFDRAALDQLLADARTAVLNLAEPAP